MESGYYKSGEKSAVLVIQEAPLLKVFYICKEGSEAFRQNFFKKLYLNSQK